jgi:hypothetical protein
MELSNCTELCKRLKQELSDAADIPPQKLSGEIREALIQVREFQIAEMNEILRKILR